MKTFILDPRNLMPDGDLRLSNGTAFENSVSGRLEVLLNGQWGTVCGIDFELSDANVACKQLGYKSATGIIIGSVVNILHKLVYIRHAAMYVREELYI